MLSKFIYLLLLFTTCSQAIEEDVLELSQLTFDSFLTSFPDTPILLQFYSPYCGYCKRFAPIYSAVYNALREQVNVTRVDGEEHRVLRLRFRVDGFPAFFLIHAGKVWRFNGPRSFEDIMLFAHSKGETHGDRLTMIGGPLSPYWSIVGKLFILADHMRTFALAYKDRPLTLLALIFGIIIFSLLLMAGLIYITTKPPAFRHPPQHAHTE